MVDIRLYSIGLRSYVVLRHPREQPEDSPKKPGLSMSPTLIALLLGVSVSGLREGYQPVSHRWLFPYWQTIVSLRKGYGDHLHCIRLLWDGKCIVDGIHCRQNRVA